LVAVAAAQDHQVLDLVVLAAAVPGEVAVRELELRELLTLVVVVVAHYPLVVLVLRQQAPPELLKFVIQSTQQYLRL
jgi:hypothetical protein